MASETALGLKLLSELLRFWDLSGVSGTRREPVHGGLGSASLPHTVPETSDRSQNLASCFFNHYHFIQKLLQFPRRQAKQLTRNNQLLDLLGALEDIDDLRIPGQLLQQELL